MANGIKGCIEIDDAGKVTVGIEPEGADDQAGAAPSGGPPGGAPAGPIQAQAASLMGGGGAGGPPGAEEGADKSYMRPAASIDAGLAMLKQMLSQAQGGGEDAQMAQGFGKPQAPTMMGA